MSIKKISNKILIVSIIIFITFGTTLSFGAVKLTKDGAKALYEYYMWQIDQSWSSTDEGWLTVLTPKIREICGDNVEMMKSWQFDTLSLQDALTSAGLSNSDMPGMWGGYQWYGASVGQSYSSDHAKALAAAISQAENEVDSNEVSNEAMEQDRRAIDVKYQLLLKSGSGWSEEKLKLYLQELDEMIKEYKAKYSWDSAGNSSEGGLNAIAKDVSDRLKAIDENANTAFDEHQNDRTEVYEQNEQINNPSTGQLGESNANGDHSIDEVIDEANKFIDTGKNKGSKIDADNLKTASDTLYNILLAFGIFLAVAIGMYLGIKFMLASAEDKAKVKEALIPYIAGCIVIFGAFVIWKLAVTILGQIQ